MTFEEVMSFMVGASVAIIVRSVYDTVVMVRAQRRQFKKDFPTLFDKDER